jgi:formylglycine-generating enzyme required for sulfatase activity
MESFLMLPEQYGWVLTQFEPEGDPWLLFDIAQTLEAQGNREGTAAVLDRDFGIAPEIEEIARHRARVLDALAVEEHGLVFRYVPAGPFLMGSNHGEPDERPWHPVWLRPYWMSETPISWAAFCRLMDWEAPPLGAQRETGPIEDPEDWRYFWRGGNKIRMQYCEDQTTRAVDWHDHFDGYRRQSSGEAPPAQDLFRPPPRDDPEAPYRHDTKPMIAVSWPGATALADRLSTGTVRYALPTEAQWEKAARGGRIGARHAWGDEPPTHERCDFNRFQEFSIRPMKTFAPNGYGLYAMNGGVWEWTRDWYDRDYYREMPDTDPPGPPQGEERVLRGGSWADCADVVTVTFRMSRPAAYGAAPNVGFRLCRTVI